MLDTKDGHTTTTGSHSGHISNGPLVRLGCGSHSGPNGPLVRLGCLRCPSFQPASACLLLPVVWSVLLLASVLARILGTFQTDHWSVWAVARILGQTDHWSVWAVARILGTFQTDHWSVWAVAMNWNSFELEFF